MKKLKNKIVITIFTILSLSFLTIITIYNSSNYIKEKNAIQKSLESMNLNHKIEDKQKKEEINHPPEKPEDEDNPRFMDVNIYTVFVEDNEIKQIINHTKDNITPKEIQIKANSIIKKYHEKKLYIGNLFWNQYSYQYDGIEKIVLIDNKNVNQELQSNLILSIIILFILEILAFIISNNISKWIIKPVEISFKKQKQFIADASHELKTPLSVIMASAEAYDRDKQEKWIKNIESESERMNHLIKNLLDLAKLENEDIPKQQEKNNLSKITEKAILPLESLIFEKNLKFQYEIEENILFQCNSEEIKQLIVIIMDNAIKHSKKAGKITLILQREKEKILLKITNQGEEIPKGEEEKIFERFYRVDKARNRNENRYGLGLAIAKKIVEQHQGIIRAYSKDNQTTFEVTFKNNIKIQNNKR